MEEFTTSITSIGQLLGTGLVQVSLTLFYRSCFSAGLVLVVSMFKPQKLVAKVVETRNISKAAIMP